MPFRSGSLSVRRYQVLTEIPETLSQVATVSLRRYLWRPIDDERGERESFGWVNPRQVLARQFRFEDLVDGTHLLLGVRRDRKAFSPVIFKARLGEMVEEVKAQKKLPKVSRQQRIALEEQLTVQMLKETSPSSAFAEVAWEMNANVLLVGATSNVLCDRITELFEATFDLKVRAQFPSVTGGEWIAAQGLEAEFHATAGGR